MLLLILADRHFGGLVEQDVGGLEHGIGVEADRGALLVLARLLLELGHPVQPAEAGDAVEDPGQIGVGAHRRLREDDRPGRIEARSQIGGRDLARLGRQLLRLLPDGDGVHVGDEDEDGRALILKLDEPLQGAEVVAQVQGAGGLDAGQDAARAGVGRGGGGRGLVSHGSNLGKTTSGVARGNGGSAAPSQVENEARVHHGLALIGSPPVSPDRRLRRRPARAAGWPSVPTG